MSAAAANSLTEKIKTKNQEFKHLNMSIAILLIFFLILSIYDLHNSNLTLSLYSLVIFIFYSAMIYTISNHLKINDKERKHQDLSMIILFLFTSLILILEFTFGWRYFGNYGPSDYNKHFRNNLVDALYFSTTSFTTIGFGDLIPQSPNGKLFLSFQGLIGSMHAVSFFSLLLLKRR